MPAASAEEIWKELKKAGAANTVLSKCKEERTRKTHDNTPNIPAPWRRSPFDSCLRTTWYKNRKPWKNCITKSCFPDNLLPTRSKTISEKSFIENEYHMYHVYNWWDVNCPIMNVWIMKYSYTIYRYDILSLVKLFKIRHRDQLREHPSWEHKGSAAFSEALSALYHPAPNPSTSYSFRPWQAEQTDPKQMCLHRFFSHTFLTCLEFSWHFLRFAGCDAPAGCWLFTTSQLFFEVRTPTRRTGSTGTPHWNAWKNVTASHAPWQNLV